MNDSALRYRRAENNAAASELFDVVIIGAGVTGACLFHKLRRKGFRVLLADKSDFAGGTSQASAMMLWGGLVYLRSLDLSTVFQLSSSRDELIRDMKEFVRPRTFRYVVPSPRLGNQIAVKSALYLYWLLGRCRRSRPRSLHHFDELAMLNKTESRNCFEYEEAHLPDSDARFVIQWILRTRSIENPALNYCAVRGGHWDHGSKEWKLDAEDLILNRQVSVRAKAVVNAAGVWADPINQSFGIETPSRHIFSKGVFIGLRRQPAHNTPIILAGNSDRSRDCFTLIPWGPVSLWGPTETVTPGTHEGFSVESEDIRILVEEYNRHFAKPLQVENIVSFRCGVRSLAVPRSARDVPHSLNLSRRHVVHRDRHVPWISIHGGKLTSCVSIARLTIDAIEQSVSPSGLPAAVSDEIPEAKEWSSFPGLTKGVRSARSCARESCWTLEDYLRRRTNISQWVPRGGLGASNENRAHLEGIAEVFSYGDHSTARSAVESYHHNIEATFDRILASLTGRQRVQFRSRPALTQAAPMEAL